MGGHHRILNREDIKFVVALIECRHCIYLDKIQEELYLHRYCHPSIPTLVCTLQRLDFSRKCVSIHTLERNDILHAAFMNTIANEVPRPNMLMFLDEAAWNQKTSIWEDTRLGFSWKEMCAEKVLCLWTAVLDPPGSHNRWNHHIWCHSRSCHFHSLCWISQRAGHSAYQPIPWSLKCPCSGQL